MRTTIAILAAALLAGAGVARPAFADCTQAGVTVTCSGNSPAGFTAGAGVNGLTLQVQTGATVGTGITLNDGNGFGNLGIVSVGNSDGTAARLGNNNVITNAGTLALGNGNGSTLVVGDNNTITNSGTISLGNAVDAVAFGKNTVITNTGAITATGAGTTALFGGDQSSPDGAGLVLTNSGTITSAFGMVAFGKSTIVNTGTMIGGNVGFPIGNIGNGSTMTNSGRLETGDNGGAAMIIIGDQGTMTNTATGTVKAGVGSYGIYAQGNGANTANAGSIQTGDAGAGMYVIGTSTATNTGTIRGGARTLGLGGESGAILVNRGTVVVGTDGVGLQAINGTITNTGSVTMGAAQANIPVGLLSSGNNLTSTNGPGGTVTGGDGSIAIAVVGDSGTVLNNGVLTTGVNGRGMTLQGTGGTVTNTGTITTGQSGIGIDDRFGTQHQITNTGRIATAAQGGAVVLGNATSFTNSGTVTAPQAGFAIFQSGAVGSTVINTGTVDGPTFLAGTAGSTMSNAGLITISAPWTGAGVQHRIDGIFTQTATGTLALRVRPTGTSDSFAVLNSQPATGIANLGGSLRALVQPGLYANTTTYAGALAFTTSTGQFASVASSSPFFNASAVYNPASVDLVLTRIPFGQVPGLANTGNGRAVGGALEAGYSPNLTGLAGTAYAKLLTSPSPAALAQLSGEVATAVTTGSFAVFSQFFATTLGQTGVARSGGGSNRTAVTIDGASAEACGAELCDMPLAFGKRVTAWAQGFGSGGSVDGNASTGSSRVEMNAGGGAVGLDLQLNAQFLLGVTLGTASSGYSLSSTPSYGSGRATLFGLYGSFAEGPAYVDAAVGYGYGSYTTTRVVSTGTIAEQLSAAFDGQQYGGRIEAGWRFAVDRAVLTPFAGLLVQAFKQNGYTETSRDLSTGGPGALGLAVQGQTTTSVRSFFGAEARSSFPLGDGNVLLPRLRVAWAHEYNPARNMNAALATLAPASTFTVQGAGAAVDAVIVGAGFDVELASGVRLFAQFDGDVASNARSFAGTGGVKLTW